MQENFVFLGSVHLENKVLEKAACKFTRTQTDGFRNESGKKFRLTKDFLLIQNYIFNPKTYHTIRNINLLKVK